MARLRQIAFAQASGSARRQSTGITDAQIRELQDIVQEAVSLAVSGGPAGISRAAQAGVSLFQLTAEQVQVLQTRQMVDPPPVLLRKLFDKLGATYIKLGQFIASSPSVFPPEYVEEFQKCLDKTTPVPFETIRAIIKSELAQPIDEVFESIDPTPLASASIAQVHRAVLRASKKDVVIKVLKPGVEDVITTDMNFLYIASRLAQWANPELGRLSLAPILGDIRTSMMEEVDFKKEASNIKQFKAYLSRSGMDAIATAPDVYDALTSRRVLVLEYLEGVPLTDYSAIRSITTQNPEEVLIGALNTWFGSVVACETFHADVHAGNLLVLQDGRVAFIDFGIVGRISKSTWIAVQKLLESTETRDFDLMARALVTIGATETDVNIPAFAADLQRLFEKIEQADTQLVVTANGQSVAASVAVDETEINRILLDLVQVGETHGVKFPREFGILVKQMMYFDRYTRLLAPEMSVYSDSRINARKLEYGDFIDV